MQGEGNVACRRSCALRCRVYGSCRAHPAPRGRHGRKALSARRRASRDRGESLTEAATDRPASTAEAGTELDHGRPPSLRIRSLFLGPGRLRKVAIGVRPSTLLAFHRALVHRKYRRLFSSSHRPRTPGPKGPRDALIRAIVELKSRNPRFGCPRIARIISRTFGVDIDKNVVARVLAKHYRPAPGGSGPSWLSFIGHATDSLWSVDLFRCESIVLQSYWVLVVMDQCTRRLVGFGVHRGSVDAPGLCRMFNAATHGQGAPRHLSTDHDPLFEAHRWQANLRLLEIDEIKTVPHVPLSHPFVERLIGTIRREFLDQVFFWNGRDLERKLADFQAYYNAARSHASLDGHTPFAVASGHPVARADLNNIRWASHCRDLVQLPAAA